MTHTFVINPASCSRTGQAVENCSCRGHSQERAADFRQLAGRAHNQQEPPDLLDIPTLNEEVRPPGGGVVYAGDALPLPEMTFTRNANQYGDSAPRRTVRGGSGSGTAGFDSLAAIEEPIDQPPPAGDAEYGYAEDRTAGTEFDDFDRDRENQKRIYGDTSDDTLPLPRMDWTQPDEAKQRAYQAHVHRG
jgi:hypothetical protein